MSAAQQNPWALALSPAAVLDVATGADNVVWGASVMWGNTGTQGCNAAWCTSGRAGETSTVAIIGEQ